MDIKKVVIPVAGLGKRFLPISRTIPKAMMPLFDRPILDYAISEALESDITEIFVVMSPSQNMIIDYYESAPDIPAQPIKSQFKTNMIKSLVLKNSVQLNFVIQENPLGLGNAILATKEFVGDYPFAIILPDDLIFSQKNPISSMKNFFAHCHSNIITVREVQHKVINQFGIVEINEGLEKNNFSSIKAMIEKPKTNQSNSNLAIVGRYVLLPSVFEYLEKTLPGANNEIQLTDAISSMIPIIKTHAFLFDGNHFDVGNPNGLIEASNFLINQ